MRKLPPSPEAKGESTLAEQVGAKATRKLRARRHSVSPVWFGLGMMGLVGWSVVVPTLLGAALGLWLDKHHPGEHSWTLALLVAGLVLGCANAWHWIDKEDKAMGEEQKNKEEKHDE
ncbi:AtpZ/AtpI family protein [Prosthecobacter fluviatilis]|uniref:AtpZ/AtpI family protein n=1 Tax=Prosthecobacter fluviatilis TaxID=445931 RepID=A0ABW0KK15_9BACT